MDELQVVQLSLHETEIQVLSYVLNFPVLLPVAIKQSVIKPAFKKDVA